LEDFLVSKRTTLEGIDQATSLREDTRIHSTRLTTYFWALIATWTIIVISLLVLDFFQIRRDQHEMAETEARANFNKDQAFRFWASKHGGVYVPIDSRTPQNPFLSHIPERDITTESGKALTLMNPAYMLRQMMEEYEDLFGVRGHITSLKHFRPETGPDQWERSALMAFERGEKEVIEFTEIQGDPHLRLMRPMTAKKSCLKCHAEQGYKVGDVRGGVSISVPTTLYVTNQRKMFTIHALALGLLWLLGIAGIFVATRGLGNRIKERDKAEAELQEAHGLLEIRVEERTADLKREIGEHKQTGEALRESERKYRKLSITDGLTKLYNSRHFYNELKKEISRTDRHHNPLSLILLDIDDFKAFNDRYGHLEGDKVLSQMGKVIKRSIRQFDSGYRYGGEEFAVLLPETNSEATFTVAERIRQTFGTSAFTPGNGEAVYSKVSIGGAQHLSNEDFKSLVRRADTALYQAKNQGKNQTVILD